MSTNIRKETRARERVTRLARTADNALTLANAAESKVSGLELKLAEAVAQSKKSAASVESLQLSIREHSDRIRYAELQDKATRKEHAAKLIEMQNQFAEQRIEMQKEIADLHSEDKDSAKLRRRLQTRNEKIERLQKEIAALHVEKQESKW